MKQKNNSDCGIVAIATLSGRPYKEVKSRYGKLDRGGMQRHELEWLLSIYLSYRLLRAGKVSVDKFCANHPLGKFLVVCERSGIQHAIAVINGKAPSDMDWKEWTVVRCYAV